MNRARIACIGLVFAIFASLLLVPADYVQATSEAPKEQHCVVQIDAVSPGQTTSRLSNFRCFSTFTESILSATGGKLRVNSPAEVTSAALSQPGVTLTLIGIDFQNTNYRGSTLLWSTSAGGCTSRHHYYANIMPSGWNDVISSSRAFSGCNRNYNFEHSYRLGEYIVCYSNCSFGSGYMNDRTSSKQWRH